MKTIIFDWKTYQNELAGEYQNGHREGLRLAERIAAERLKGTDAAKVLHDYCDENTSIISFVRSLYGETVVDEAIKKFRGD